MSTVIIQKPLYPAFLLSPDGSRDADGAVDPSIFGDVTVVEGEYGQAWDCADAGAVGGTWPLGEYTGGTLIIRFNGTPLSYAMSHADFSMISIWGDGSEIHGGVANIQPPLLSVPAISGSTWAALSWERDTFIRIQTPTDSEDSPLTGGAASDGAGTTVSVGTDTGQQATIESLLLFNTVLTPEEVERIANMPAAWTWENATVYRPEEVRATTPARHGSRVSHVETVAFETDRDNRPGVELSGITNVDVDWDIDRSGSKARIDIATHKRVLKDGMWVAPYLRITPEVGDIIYQQLGHYRLGLPSTIVDGSVDTFGDDKVEQSATGGDIVDLLAQAGLPYTFYTPRRGHVMTDVHNLIKMATCGMMGPNLVQNGSFESEGSNWNGPSWTSGGSGSVSWDSPAAWTTPDGAKVYRPIFSTSNPAGGVGFVATPSSSMIQIPNDAEYMYVSGLKYTATSSMRMYISVRFHDSSGDDLGSSHYAETQRATPVNQWSRQFMVFPVPDQATQIRLFVFVTDTLGGRSSSGAWDDIRLGTATQMPIPDSRINLPSSNAIASTRIQTTAGNSIGYEAINADRLAAIGHHAIYTDLTGRLTASPSRDLGSATVARTYQEGDYRFIGATEVQRSANNRYNTVTAVKESFEEGVPPMFVTVWNDDPDDPWSVHYLGNVRYPNGPLMVQDAVDTDALESAALATLERATMQHTLRIQVLPDPTLSVHDVIEIVGGPEEAQGRWLVEYLRPGVSANDPIVEIGARRTLSSAGVSGVDMGGG